MFGTGPQSIRTDRKRAVHVSAIDAIYLLTMGGKTETDACDR